jgi:glutathione peroxidase
VDFTLRRGARRTFEKFLVAADGTVLQRWSPRTEPEDSAVVGAIESALA